jgi:hypothetical protein
MVDCKKFSRGASTGQDKRWIENKKPNKNSQRYNGEKKQCEKLGTENRIT